MDIEQIKQMTIEEGQGWGYAHVYRVLQLIETIGADLAYDRQAILFATYLHDWGAFPKYLQPGMDHALRSRQLAVQEILPQTNLPPSTQVLIAEAIELHDYRDSRPTTSPESLLLREADSLDMLGVIGIVRVFAWGPNNLQQCYERVLARRARIAGRFTLPRSKELAEQRLSHMETTLQLLQQESFGRL